MALTSPGVQVTVIDESFFTPAGPGLTPLIVVATAQNKVNSAGQRALGTTKENAGRAFRLTSQRDLVDLFGTPFFEQSPGANPVHGGERNEYGLLAAYSFMGVSNSAFVTRADVDLAQLRAQPFAPGSAPADGQWWVDAATSIWGIQEWNAAPASVPSGQRFAYQVPIVLSREDSNRITGGDYGPQPKESVGSIGNYAVVFENAQDDLARFFYKTAGNPAAGVQPGEWVLVGSTEWKASHPSAVADAFFNTSYFESNSTTFTINDTMITVSQDDTLADVVAAINAASITGVTARAVGSRLYLYSDGTSLGAGEDTTEVEGVIRVISTDVDGIEAVGFDVAVGETEFDAIYFAPALQQSPHTVVPQWRLNDDRNRPSGSVWVKTTEPNFGARWRIRYWDEGTQSWVETPAPLYASTHEAVWALDRAGGGSIIPVDSLFVQYDANTNQTAKFKIWRRSSVGETTIRSLPFEAQSFQGTFTFTIEESVPGQRDLRSVEVVAELPGDSAEVNADAFAGAINGAGLLNVEAVVVDGTRVEISHQRGGDFRIQLGNAQTPFAKFVGSLNFVKLATDYWLASNWEPFVLSDFAVSKTAPLNEPEEGQLWYNPEISEVDLMVHDGNTWVGLNNSADYGPEAEVIVSASRPQLSVAQKEVNNHIWVDTSSLEDFPVLYRWNADLVIWEQLDVTDQVTEDGVLFADARYGVTGELGSSPGSIEALRNSDYIDPDAPDPALYPRGMLLWNLRRSGGNVKRYRRNYIDQSQDNPRVLIPTDDGFSPEPMADYATDRWTTASANTERGVGTFGRFAQRAVVVSALKSVVDTSEEIRDEERRNFNLIATPGYPELMSNLVNLNIDRGLTAFVLGDTPLRLPADTTSLLRWGTNEELVTDNGDDGIVTFDEYMAVFYPNGFTTDLGGNNVVVPATHMMLRTIALSDNVGFPWFAPAGTRRGGITNATAVGFLERDTGEFRTLALNEGQRDVLYDLQINPISFFTGVGLVNYGQKTRARAPSALDRINVARLVVYLRTQLNRLARPYIFEPNDRITRDEIKQAVESLLLELVGLRALNDFAVVCDESNNTPARIDRNELWVDIAIEPIKAIEFIYIPLRVQSTGTI